MTQKKPKVTLTIKRVEEAYKKLKKITKKPKWPERFDDMFTQHERDIFEDYFIKIKDFIAQEKAKTAREVLGEAEKLVAKDRLIFLKNDVASLVSQNRDLRVRKQLRKEILRDIKDLKKKYEEEKEEIRKGNLK